MMRIVGIIFGDECDSPHRFEDTKGAKALLQEIPLHLEINAVPMDRYYLFYSQLLGDSLGKCIFMDNNVHRLVGHKCFCSIEHAFVRSVFSP